MIELVNARVYKYKSIEDSSSVAIDEDVTILVGKNESGKTAFLEALHKSLPLAGGVKFNYVFDYPRKDYVRYQAQHQNKAYATVVELTFRLQPELIHKINKEVFNGAHVLPAGFQFTRYTNYGNNVILGLQFDDTAALTALKKPLSGVEGVDAIFSNAAKLDDVIAAIEAKQYAGDTTLGAFAAEWRTRTAKRTGSWGLLDWYVWSSYLSEPLPRFLYFDDYMLLEGKINLETLNARKANSQLNDSDKTALGLFDLAGISLPELMSEEGYENSKAKLEAIGLTITEQVFQYWTQNQDSSGKPALAVEFDIKADPKDTAPYNTGKNLYIRIKNLRHGVTVPFDQRSKGFIWFFSFMVWFSSVEERVGATHDVILLLDEPGLSLHALAQADFMDYIETLSETRQILYTTHSPFMIDSERLDRIRVVEDRPKEGTKVSQNLEGSSEESLFPLQAALGYTIAQNLFIAQKNLLVEGPADLILLQHMSALVEQSGRTGLVDSVIVPVGGVDKIATFIALMGANKLSIAVLHDRAGAPSQGIESMVRQKLIERNRVLDFAMFREPANSEADIEDLFPENLYLEAFNETYSKELKGKSVESGALGQHPRIVERLNGWLEDNGIQLLKAGGFNHYRVAQMLLTKLTAAHLSTADIDRFEQLFVRVNEALS